MRTVTVPLMLWQQSNAFCNGSSFEWSLPRLRC